MLMLGAAFHGPEEWTALRIRIRRGEGMGTNGYHWRKEKNV